MNLQNILLSRKLIHQVVMDLEKNYIKRSPCVCIQMLFFLIASHATCLVKVEPPFWFTGLKNSELQLFITGENVGLMNPSSKLKITNISKLESPNYLVVYFDLSKVSPGTYEIVLHSESGDITLNYELKQKREKRPRTFDSSDVVYLIMPDRFSDGNQSLDNIPMSKEYKVDRGNPDARHGGDLLGIENHLEYIQDLGVTAIWMTPILENDNTGGCYHGYAATDHYLIDPRFGTNEDYKRLVELAHKRGIKIIQDVVFNHISNEHRWMVDVPSKDFFNFFDHYTETQHDMDVHYSPYASDYDTEIFLKGWFVPSMPDMNQRNYHVLRYLIQHTIWWIEYADIDGYRQDTYPYCFYEPMVEWTKEITNEYPDFNIVGETFRTNPIVTSYWQKGSKLNERDTGLKSVMDFKLMDISRSIFTEENQFNNLHEHMGYDFVYPNISSVLRFVENHDTNRFHITEPTDIRPFKQAMAFLFTIPGIPQIYYGSEILLFGEKSKSDGYVRKDFPGGWPGDKNDCFYAAGRTALQNQAFYFIKSLLDFRKGNEVISKGTMKHFYPKNGIYAYERKYKNQSILVFLNGNNKKVDVTLEQYQEILRDGIHFKDELNGRDYYLNRTFSMDAKDVLVLKSVGHRYSPPAEEEVKQPNEPNQIFPLKIIAFAGSILGVVILVIIFAYVLIFKRSRNNDNEAPTSLTVHLNQE